MKGLRTVRLLAAGAVLSRLASGAKRHRPLRADDDDAAAQAAIVSVVVPARDEEHRIGPCLAALAADPAVREVIVVDDGSSDATAAVARAAGARVVAGTEPPRPWAGKTWALQQGLEAASGDWVVTLDADTRPKPGLVRAAVAAAIAHDADLVSVGTRFDCASGGERLLHPAMLATLVYRFGPPDRASRAPAGRVLANGQCMVVPRRAFLADGGFARVASSLTEDVALARHLARRHQRVRFLDGTSLIEAAGYGSAPGVWEGWGRSFALAEVTSPVSQAADLATIWLTLAAPPLRLLFRRGDPLDWLLLAVRLALLVALAPAYRRRGAPYWLSPIADIPVAGLLTASTLRPSRRWRGRSYPPP